MRLILASIIPFSLALAAPLAPAAAQAQAAINVGMPVVDSAGAPVGSVAGLDGENIMIKTDKHEALLPKASFTVDGAKLLFGMTQAQLNAEIEKTVAASDAAIVAGATVKGASGAAVGVVDAVAADSVTIKLASGQKIQIARSGVRGNADGTVVIGLSAEQLEAQVHAATASAPAPAEATETGGGNVESPAGTR